MKSLLLAWLAAMPLCAQLWTAHVRDGVQMLPIMSCGDYDWNNGGRVVKQPDCLMVHIKPAVPVQRVLVTVHVDPAENGGVPWIWLQIDSHDPWSIAAFEQFGNRRILAIDIEGFSGDQSVWWVSFPMR